MDFRICFPSFSAYCSCAVTYSSRLSCSGAQTLLQCDVYRYLALQVRGPPLGLTFNQFGFYPYIDLSSRHSVAGWYLPDLCLLRHATLPIGFPLRISRTMTGYWNTCLVLAKVQLSNGLYGRTEHFPKSFEIAAFVDLGIGGSMCHLERVFG